MVHNQVRVRMFQILRRNVSTVNTKTNVDSDLASRLASHKININYLDSSTLKRLSVCSPSFLSNLASDLETFGIRDKQMARILKNYDDWSELNHANLNASCDMFRKMAFSPELYLEMISTRQELLSIQPKALSQRLHELKHFFTKKHLDKLLFRSPSLIVDNFDSFRYKFTYVFQLMKIGQDEMCKSYVFNKSLDHIRQRHLFLERSGFYDKPNKKGITKIVNPKLQHIMDLPLKAYLSVCTGDVFREVEFETFCEYLRLENFDDELLGNNIGNTLEKQIISTIRQEKYDNSLLSEKYID